MGKDWRARMTLYRTFLVISGLVCLVVVGFFLAGLADGSVSSYNIAMWVPLVGIPMAVLFVAMQLKAKGRNGAATTLLATLAIPGLLGCGFVLLMIVMSTTNPGAFR